MRTAAGDGAPATAPPEVREELDELVVALYRELRASAHRLAGNGTTTLATTALVHEAYLKLADGAPARWRDRAHFLAVAAVAMRHILADRARARMAEKRGGGAAPVTLGEDTAPADDRGAALLAVDEALDRLAAIDGRLARVVECRFYAGLTDAEIAAALGVTTRTVERDWVKARALLRELLAS